LALRNFVPALALLTGLALQAGAGTLDYDVTYGPLRVGRLALERGGGAGGYEAALSIRSAGLAGVVRPVHFAAWSSGRMADGLPQPGRYREEADTGRRVSAAEMVWQDGLPVVQAYRADPAETVAPAGAVAGALDPASAFLAALAGPRACGLAFAVFDGQRLSSLVLEEGRRTGDAVSCAGRFTRLGGYRPEDIAERESFALQLTYAAGDEGFVLVAAEVQTLYGKVRLKRR
jgi:hypothetical protein